MLAPSLRDEYGLSLTQVGVVITAEWIGLTLSLLPWGVRGRSLRRALDARGRSHRVCGLSWRRGIRADYASLVALLVLAGALGGSVQSGSGRAVTSWFGA